MPVFVFHPAEAARLVVYEPLLGRLPADTQCMAEQVEGRSKSVHSSTCRS